MNEDLGKIFQAIRKSKHLTMMEVTDKSISQSQLSRFERGESSLTLDKFLHLLENSQVALDEFQSIAEGYALTDEEKFHDRLLQAYTTQNSAQMRQILKDCEAKYQLEPQKKYLQLNKLVVKTIFANMAHFEMDKEEIEYLKEYLISVDDWGRYELWIFSNTIQLFNDATLSLLMGGILQKTVFYQNIMVNRQLVIRIMLNLVALWIQRENFPLAQRYIRYLDKENLSTDFLYERLMVRYNKGFYRYKNGDKTGLVLMRECNEILGKLGCFEQENNLDKVIDDLD